MTSPGAHTSGPFSPRRGNGPAVSAEGARRGIDSGNGTDIGAGNGGQGPRKAAAGLRNVPCKSLCGEFRPKKNLFFDTNPSKIWRFQILTLYLHTRNEKFGSVAQVVKLVDTLL